MTGIIVTGHGHFPAGILSAIALVAGKPENTAGVDFKEGCSSSDLKEAMKLAMESLEGALKPTDRFDCFFPALF